MVIYTFDSLDFLFNLIQEILFYIFPIDWSVFKQLEAALS